MPVNTAVGAGSVLLFLHPAQTGTTGWPTWKHFIVQMHMPLRQGQQPFWDQDSPGLSTQKDVRWQIAQKDADSPPAS